VFTRRTGYKTRAGKIMIEMPEIVGVKQVAQFFNVSPGAITSWSRKKYIPSAAKYGRRWVFNLTEIRKALKTCNFYIGQKESEEETIRKQRVYRQKDACRYVTARAILEKKIFKKPCEICGDTVVHAHHNDYTDPFNITWLCPKHHYALHTEVRRQNKKAA
jgi:ribosomal protein S27AE